MDPMDSGRRRKPSARLSRTGWSTGWKRPKPRQNETSARLAHAPKPSGGWQTVRGGGSVDHLPLVGETRRIFLLSLLNRPSSSSLSLHRRFLASVSVSGVSCDPAHLCIAIPRKISFLFEALLSPWKIVKNLRFLDHEAASHRRVFFSFFFYFIK